MVWFTKIYMRAPLNMLIKNQPGNSNRSWNTKSDYYEIKIEMQAEGMQENIGTKGEGEVKRK